MNHARGPELLDLSSRVAGLTEHLGRVLAEAGASVMLPQADLNGESLAAAVTRLMGDTEARSEMASRARARGKPHAAEEIVSNLLTLVQ